MLEKSSSKNKNNKKLVLFSRIHIGKCWARPLKLLYKDNLIWIDMLYPVTMSATGKYFPTIKYPSFTHLHIRVYVYM